MSTNDILTKDDAHRRFLVGKEPMIFHCHHYNAFLQQTIQDADYVDSRPFLIGAANEVAYAQLSELFRELELTEVEARKELAQDLYRWAGFGTMDLSDLSEEGGVVRSENSHYSHAWTAKFGRAEAPVDFFGTGWLSGALAAIYDHDQGSYRATQSSCMGAGDEQNEYLLERAESPNYRVFTSPATGPLTEHALVEPPPSPVDYEGIYTALTGMRIVGDEQGCIDTFGVYLTRHYANYYNRISFEFMKALSEMLGGEGPTIAEPLLVEAGHVCAFNTFGGIMTSAEWDALIKPSLKSKEDWVHGIVAAVNALGWGRWQVESLSADEAVFVIHDDYESVGHLAAYGTTEERVSHLAHGGVRGIMNLVYLGNVEDKPTFSEEVYQKLFRSSESYQSEQLANRAAGDPVTRFRVYRSPPAGSLSGVTAP